MLSVQPGRGSFHIGITRIQRSMISIIIQADNVWCLVCVLQYLAILSRWWSCQHHVDVVLYPLNDQKYGLFYKLIQCSPEVMMMNESVNILLTWNKNTNWMSQFIIWCTPIFIIGVHQTLNNNINMMCTYLETCMLTAQ